MTKKMAAAGKSPKNPAAVALGQMTSPRKKLASMQNGRLGGRPPKPDKAPVLSAVARAALRVISENDARVTEVDAPEVIGPRWGVIVNGLAARGLVKWRGGRLAMTAAGRDVL